MGAEARHEARVAFLRSKDYGQKKALTLEEVHQLEQIFLGMGDRPVVYVLAQGQDIMQSLFDSRIYMKTFDVNAPLVGNGKYLLLEPGYTEVLSKDAVQTVNRVFPRHVITTSSTGWEVWSSP